MARLDLVNKEPSWDRVLEAIGWPSAVVLEACSIVDFSQKDGSYWAVVELSPMTLSPSMVLWSPSVSSESNTGDGFALFSSVSSSGGLLAQWLGVEEAGKSFSIL